MIKLYAHEHPKQTSKKAHRPKLGIFLAGPSPRGEEDYSWRPEALKYLAKKKFPGTVYIPLPRNGEWSKDYDGQVDWELKYLNEATVIAFWIPRDLKRLPAFTTNVEFGLYVRSGKIILGYPKGAPKMRYPHLLAQKNNVSVFHTLSATLDAAVKLAKKRSKKK
jgi:hypothetical protein